MTARERKGFERARALPAAYLALGRVLGAAGTTASSRSGRIRAIPIPTRSSRISPAPCATAPASRSRWCAAAGWSAGPGPTIGAAATSSCRCPGTPALDLLGARTARGCATPRPRRGLRRLLWLGQRRALPPRAEPDPPLSEHRAGRLCPLGQQLQLRRIRRCSCRISSATTSDLTKRNVSWEQIAEHSEIVLAFGGMALKNSMVAGGGISQHVERGAMARARARAAASSCWSSPLRDDLPEEAGAEWMPIIPGTDTALMLALVHTLVVEGLHDRAFLDRYYGRLAGRSSAICWARPTASPRMPPGPPRSPASRPTTIVALAPQARTAGAR